MKARSLRHILSVRSLWISLAPFLLSAILGWFWLRPQVVADTEERQQQLAAVIASRTEGYLVSSSRAISSVASVLSKRLVAPSEIQVYLDTKLASSKNLTSLALTDSAGRISVIALPGLKSARQQEMHGIDLSRTTAVRQVLATGKPAWSDAFLSLVGGGLAVAYATPAGDGVAIGEISLDQLGLFLREIADQGKQSVFIIDRRGQVIADQEGRYTARQHNLTNLGIVRDGLASGKPLTRRFSSNGERLIGSMIRAPLLDWSILVASPMGVAFRAALTTTGIFATALCMALLLASVLSLLMSRSLARRFENLVSHARRIESGEDAGEWPKAPVSEFNHLGTALQRMAETLRDRENRLESFFSLSPDLLLVSDTDGTIRKLNTAWEDALGFPLEEMIGGRIIDYVHPDDLAAARAAEEELATQRTVREFVSRYRRRDGSYRWLEWHAAPCGDLRYGIARDITDRKKAEEEKAILEEELLQSRKMESLGRIAGGIAHDFNNLLHVIIGYAEMLASVSREGKTQDYARNILSASLRAAELTRGLLAYSRKQPLRLVESDLNLAVRRVHGLLNRVIGEDVALVLNLHDGALPVLIDEGQIDQVLMNLAANARDAMPGGGILTIETGEQTMDEDFISRLGFGEPGNWATLYLRDNGIGMEEETRARIFEPFFTTKELGRGTGLGLSIVYGIIRQHNGFIQCGSKPAAGSVFTIYLPLRPSARPPSPEKKPVDGISRGSGETILIAEDDDQVRNITRFTLEEAGYRVIVARDGIEAVELFRAHRGSIDLLLFDVIMPGKNGREALEEIRSLDSDVKACFISGYSDDILRDRGISAPSVPVLSKPLEPFRLTGAIRSLLDNR
jgi:PAS domain S-box-containing protein